MFKGIRCLPMALALAMAFVVPLPSYSQTRNAEACTINPAATGCKKKTPAAPKKQAKAAEKKAAPVKKTTAAPPKKAAASGKACPKDEFECTFASGSRYGIRAMTKEPGARNCVMVMKRSC
ncbi:MAG: hypothetical protein ACK4GO_08370 [Gemmobacter sp.]